MCLRAKPSQKEFTLKKQEQKEETCTCSSNFTSSYCILLFMVVHFFAFFYCS